MAAAPLQIPVAVIGAGTFGVSVGLALHARGIRFQQLGRPFELWMRHTLPGFALRSDVRASGVYAEDGSRSLLRWVRASLPPAAARRAEMRRMPGPLFRRYLRWVVDTLPYEVCSEYVTRLDRRDGAFHLETEAGTRLEAQHVVVASGIESHRHLPACIAALGADRVTHSWDADTLARLRGERLLIVGGGQSAAEGAAYLARGNRVTWVHREALDFFAEPVGLPTPAYEAVARVTGHLHRLPAPLRRVVSERFIATTITPELRRPLSRLALRRERRDAAQLGFTRENGGVRSVTLGESYDRVVAATGYRFGLGSLGFLAEPLRRAIAARGDVPVLDAGFQTSVPGLFVVGGLALASHGAAQRFMMGSRHAAVGVGDAIAAAYA